LPQAGPSEAPEHIEDTDPVLEAFDRVCIRLSGFDDTLSTENLDGYLAAVAASGRTIDLQEVLSRRCADAFERAFADPADEAAARAALQARLDELRLALEPEALLDDPDHLRLFPLMGIWDDDSRQALVQAGICTPEQAAGLFTGMSWAGGFFRALDDFSADWPDPDARDELAGLYFELIETVAALMLDPASDEFQAFVAEGWKDADPTREELIDEACLAVQDLRLWWIDHPPKRAPLRAAVKPGRNDPCFCGSGLKYKKCHGA
jgi:uncharacterized protein